MTKNEAGELVSGIHGLCPHCQEDHYLSRHHVFPKCHFYGKRDLLKFKIPFCRPCHILLEAEIREREGRDERGKRNKLPSHFYLQIVLRFCLHTLELRTVPAGTVLRSKVARVKYQTLSKAA